MRQVMLMIGTRKGAFLAFSGLDRRGWQITEAAFRGGEVNHVGWIHGPTPLVVATAKSAWWGPDLRVSRDFGQTWSDAIGLRFAPGRERSVERIWVVESTNGGGSMYAGVDPGALFFSSDGGTAWTEVVSLSDHPTREQWHPGLGGLMVHSICADPLSPRRLLVAMSAVGVFRSDDGGETWAPKNRGVYAWNAEFLPDKFPPIGQCPHHLEMHPSRREVIYQQNHCGVYRTDDAGESWIDISDGLPSRFGFPLAVHPHDGETVYVVPEESYQSRVTCGGAFRVYRSRDGGGTWRPLTDGLPQANAYANVFRMAMATDVLDPAGVYVGTQGGQILASRDEGEHWDLLFNWLPPVYSLETAVIER
jgi:photosystem II stability/assembly factor-like uncharacterized protein